MGNSTSTEAAAVPNAAALNAPNAAALNAGTIQIVRPEDKGKSNEVLSEEVKTEREIMRKKVDVLKALNMECQAAKNARAYEKCKFLSECVVNKAKEVEMHKRRVLHLLGLKGISKGVAHVEFFAVNDQNKSDRHILYEMEAIVPVTNLLNSRAQELKKGFDLAKTSENKRPLALLLRSTSAEAQALLKTVQKKALLLKERNRSVDPDEAWKLFIEAKEKDADALLAEIKSLEEAVDASNAADVRATLERSLGEKHARLAVVKREIKMSSIALDQNKRFCHLKRMSFRNSAMVAAVKAALARKDTGFAKIASAHSKMLAAAVVVINEKFQQVNREMKSNKEDYIMYGKFLGPMRRRCGPDAMRTGEIGKEESGLTNDARKPTAMRKDEVDDLPVATAVTVTGSDFPMGDLVMVTPILEEPVLVEEVVLTSGSDETEDAVTHSIEPALAGTVLPDPTEELPERSFESTLQAVIDSMPDLPAGLEALEGEEAGEGVKTDESSRKPCAS
jgi:hypothetical protein